MRKLTSSILLLIVLTLPALAQQQPGGIPIAKVKYNGGGDWYANKTALPNLIQFANQHLNMNLAEKDAVVEVGSPELFS